MTTIVDGRGLACPQPVILTRRAMRETDSLVTIVDNDTAQHNVTRMSEKHGFQVRAEAREDSVYLYIARGDGPPIPETQASEFVPGTTLGPTVLLVSSEAMGRGEHLELGNVLIRAFFHTLSEVEPLPDTVIFLNSGVKLVVEGSPVLEDLRALDAQGIEILACGTCLNYYELGETLRVGQVSNMYTIAELLLNAGRQISL